MAGEIPSRDEMTEELHAIRDEIDREIHDLTSEEKARWFRQGAEEYAAEMGCEIVPSETHPNACRFVPSGQRVLNEPAAMFEETPPRPRDEMMEELKAIRAEISSQLAAMTPEERIHWMNEGAREGAALGCDQVPSEEPDV